MSYNFMFEKLKFTVLGWVFGEYPGIKSFVMTGNIPVLVYLVSNEKS